MKIYNPTNNKIEVTIFGRQYAIEAEGTLTGIPSEVATYWGGLHEFLKISEDETKQPTSEKAPEMEKDKKVETKSEEKPTTTRRTASAKTIK